MISLEKRKALREMPATGPVRMQISMCQREALLLSPEQNREGHIGVWFYPSENFPNLMVGQIIVFHCNDDVYAIGRIDSFPDPADYPKYCSGLNDKCFTWTPWPPPRS